MIKRTIQKNVENALFKGKIIIIYGARQVGKTTLIKEIQKKHEKASVYLNCDEPDIRSSLTDATSTEIKSLFGSSELIFIDEAQRVKNIGLALKLAADNFPDIQIVATGSSSFELSNRIAEPLTGRSLEFYLYPLSYEEIAQEYSEREAKRMLEQRILHGMYPEVVRQSLQSRDLVKNIANNYLYKDVLAYQSIKRPEALETLLQALALQIGSEVSYSELASAVGIDKKTVEQYIRLLEAAFIVFRLRPLHRNARNELKKMRKIYFYDTGIRNALINNFNPFSLRQDVGALWENFIIAERLKFNHNHKKECNTYFWRTHQQQELDYVEDSAGTLRGYEFKWRESVFRKPKAFLEAYPGSIIELVNKDAIDSFLLEPLT